MYSYSFLIILGPYIYIYMYSYSFLIILGPAIFLILSIYFHHSE